LPDDEKQKFRSNPSAYSNEDSIYVIGDNAYWHENGKLIPHPIQKNNKDKLLKLGGVRRKYISRIDEIKSTQLEKIEINLANYILKNRYVVNNHGRVWCSGLFAFRTVIPCHELAKFKLVRAYQTLRDIKKERNRLGSMTYTMESDLVSAIKKDVADQCAFGRLKYSNDFKSTANLEAALDITKLVNKMVCCIQKEIAAQAKGITRS
jgi:hypothetical protein